MSSKVDNTYSRVNKNEVLLEVGKTYHYFNIGLREVKEHTIKYFSSDYAVASDGKVHQDSLY